MARGRPVPLVGYDLVLPSGVDAAGLPAVFLPRPAHSAAKATLKHHGEQRVERFKRHQRRFGWLRLRHHRQPPRPGLGYYHRGLELQLDLELALQLVDHGHRHFDARRRQRVNYSVSIELSPVRPALV